MQLTFYFLFTVQLWRKPLNLGLCFHSFKRKSIIMGNSPYHYRNQIRYKKVKYLTVARVCGKLIRVPEPLLLCAMCGPDASQNQYSPFRGQVFVSNVPFCSEGLQFCILLRKTVFTLSLETLELDTIEKFKIIYYFLTFINRVNEHGYT